MPIPILLGVCELSETVVRPPNFAEPLGVLDPYYTSSNPCSLSNHPVLPVLESEDFISSAGDPTPKLDNSFTIRPWANVNRDLFGLPWPPLGRPWATFSATFFTFLQISADFQ